MATLQLRYPHLMLPPLLAIILCQIRTIETAYIRGRYHSYIEIENTVNVSPRGLNYGRMPNVVKISGGVEGGVWIGIYAPHGAGIIRIYGHNMKGRKSKSLLRKNLKVVDNYLLTAPPIQFPINEVVDFRPSLYTETAGLSARLLQMLLDVAKLRLRLNQLLLAVTQAESEGKQNR